MIEKVFWAVLFIALSIACLLLFGCSKTVQTPPLPPDLSVPYCRTIVLVSPEDLCGRATTFAPFYQCVRCRGGEGCIARDMAIYCVSGGCGDLVCQ